MKPILAEWCYLWLQKQHLHGIEKKEVINYILEGAVARSDLAMKLRMIETSLSKVKSTLGLECVEPDLTHGHCKTLSVDHLRQRRASLEGFKRQISDELEKEENQDEAALLSSKLDSLSTAKDAATEEARLMNDIFNAEETLEDHLKNVAEQTLNLGQEILSLQKEIEFLENPRDKSQDNDTVLWCSPCAFHSSVLDEVDESDNEEEEEEGAVKSLGPESVEGIISTIEQAGFTCKRSSDPDEAIDYARKLLASKRLRCVIFGGGEKSNGCGKSCTQSHDDDGTCLCCGQIWDYHSSDHRCTYPSSDQSSRRGSFRSSKSKDGSDVDVMSQFFSHLYNGTEGVHDVGIIPVERTCLYAGNSCVPEATRIALWESVTNISENSTSLVSWISSIPAWNEVEKDKDEEDVDEIDNDKEKSVVDFAKLKRPIMTRQKSVGSTRLDECRNELEKCLLKKKSLESANEDEKQVLRNCTVAKHHELVEVIQCRLNTIETYIDETATFESISDDVICEVIDDTYGSGASSGRDAAHAIAWIDWFLSHNISLQKEIENKPDYNSTLRSARRGLLAEKEGLCRVLLAAKIMTFVNSPTHKKLMNLSHDWLRTFLPHCLSKVDRVSFGLLTSEECLTALDEDPLVPRSRLGLAVPFMGKDVPSKSAEFAHPGR